MSFTFTQNDTTTTADVPDLVLKMPLWVIILSIVVGTNILLVVGAVYYMVKKRKLTVSQLELELRKRSIRVEKNDSFSDDPDEEDTWSDNDDTKSFESLPSSTSEEEETGGHTKVSDESGWG